MQLFIITFKQYTNAVQLVKQKWKKWDLKLCKLEKHTVFRKPTIKHRFNKFSTYNWYKKHFSLWWWKVFDMLIESLNTKFSFNKGFVQSSRLYLFNTNWTFWWRILLFFFWCNFAIYKCSSKKNLVKENLVKTNISKSTVKKMIKDSCTKTAFSFNGKIYKWIDGVSMGSSIWPVLANVIMMEFGRLVLDKLIKDSSIKFYIRYVNYMLVLANVEDIDNMK